MKISFTGIFEAAKFLFIIFVKIILALTLVDYIYSIYYVVKAYFSPWDPEQFWVPTAAVNNLFMVVIYSLLYVAIIIHKIKHRIHVSSANKKTRSSN